MQREFKVGQKVKNNGNGYACRNVLPNDGTVLETWKDSLGNVVVGTTNRTCTCYTGWQLVEEEKTWETLAKGDVIILGAMSRNVIEVLGDIVFEEDPSSPGIIADLWTKQRYQKEGWTIKQPKKPEEVTEMTVAECAKKLGVKNLKIVE